MSNLIKESQITVSNIFSERFIVLNSDKEKLVDFNKSELVELLKVHGAILFRNFQVDLSGFSDFIKQNSSRVTCDPARKKSVENAQLIQAGTGSMGLHIENGNLPFLPDLQWLYCEKAPGNASRTTLCDGHKFWQNMSSVAKNKFKSKRIKYTRNIPEHLWRQYLSIELGIDIEKVDPTHLKAVNRMLQNQRYILNDDGSVFSEYKVYAAHPTIFSEQIAFANSIMGPSFNYEAPKITFEDDEPFSESLKNECLELAIKLTVPIEWQDGDVVVVDNSSVMHGREEIKDPSRKIYGGQSYL